MNIHIVKSQSSSLDKTYYLFQVSDCWFLVVAKQFLIGPKPSIVNTSKPLSALFHNYSHWSLACYMNVHLSVLSGVSKHSSVVPPQQFRQGPRSEGGRGRGAREAAVGRPHGVPHVLHLHVCGSVWWEHRLVLRIVGLAQKIYWIRQHSEQHQWLLHYIGD